MEIGTFKLKTGRSISVIKIIAKDTLDLLLAGSNIATLKYNAA
jgi:hypothetical protein